MALNQSSTKPPGGVPGKIARGAMWLAILTSLFSAALDVSWNASLWVLNGQPYLYSRFFDVLPVGLIIAVIFAICRTKKGITPRSVGITCLISLIIASAPLAIIHGSHPRVDYQFLRGHQAAFTVDTYNGFTSHVYTFEGDVRKLERQAVPELRNKGLFPLFAIYDLPGANHRTICSFTATAGPLKPNSRAVGLESRPRLEALGLHLDEVEYLGRNHRGIPSHLLFISPGRATGRHFDFDSEVTDSTPDPGWVTVEAVDADPLSMYP